MQRILFRFVIVFQTPCFECCFIPAVPFTDSVYKTALDASMCSRHCWGQGDTSRCYTLQLTSFYWTIPPGNKLPSSCKTPEGSFSLSIGARILMCLLLSCCRTNNLPREIASFSCILRIVTVPTQRKVSGHPLIGCIER